MKWKVGHTRIAGVVAALSIIGAVGVVTNVGCAHVGSARHASTVSLVVLHQTLSTIQDSEGRLVCGRTSAPESPQCVPILTHQRISGMLARAFALDAQAAAITRDLPDGDKGVAVLTILGDIGGLVREVLSLIPASPQRDSIVGAVDGTRPATGSGGGVK